MADVCIDIETLGTNVDSQIIQVGACVFDPTEDIIVEETFCSNVRLDNDAHINATPGTIRFWCITVADNPAMLDVLNNSDGVPMETVLTLLRSYCVRHNVQNVWANGTKFDIAMLEYQFKAHGVRIPWNFNSDRCMRTIKAYNPNHEYCVAEANKYPLPGLGLHDALTDAVWQARYIQLALSSMNEQGLKNI